MSLDMVMLVMVGSRSLNHVIYHHKVTIFLEYLQYAIAKSALCLKYFVFFLILKKHKECQLSLTYLE